MLATLRAKNQITLPSDIIKQLKLKEKSQIDINVNEKGQIILTPIEIVDKKLIDDLKESLNDIKNGNVSEAMTAEELIKKLGL
jgi:antitoxin component of MazEF toxin-antitoxin module